MRFRSSFVLVFVFIFPALAQRSEAQAPRVVWTATDVIQSEVENHSILSEGVRRLNPGDYSATDTALLDASGVENGFSGNLGLRDLNFSGRGNANDRFGLFVDGNLLMEKGTVLAVSAEKAGFGVGVSGNVHGTDVVISAVGDGYHGEPSVRNYSRGLSVSRGDVHLNGANVEAVGLNLGEGITLEHGGIFQNGGNMNARGIAGPQDTAGQGIVLYDGNYELTAGTMQAAGENGGVGLWLEKGDADKGNFLADRGTITIDADGTGADPFHGGVFGSVGIYVMDGRFRLDATSLDITATRDAHGIEIMRGDFVQNDGTLTIRSRDGSDSPEDEKEKASIGILVHDGDFSLSGASVNIEAGNGLGILLKNGDMRLDGSEVSILTRYGNGVVVDGGNLTVTGGTLTAESFDGPVAIYVQNHLGMSSGLLYLKQGNGAGRTVAAGSIGLGEDFTLRLDIGRYGAGRIEATGDIAIADGARLEVKSFDSVYLDKRTRFGAAFMKSETGVITGEFVQPEDTLTLDYQALKTRDGKEYYLEVARSAFVSEWLQGANRSLAEALEQNLPEGTDYRPLVEAYDALDRARTVDEMASMARSLTPWQATRFAGILVHRADLDQFDLSRNLGEVRRNRIAPTCDPCMPIGSCTKKDGSWHRWYSAHGNFAHYGGKSASFSDLDVDSYGFRVGLARKIKGFGRNAAFGASFNYTHGDIDGNRSDGYRSDSDFDSYGFLAALRTGLRKHSWLEWTCGYSYARFDQGRYDYSGNRYDSKVDDHLFRFGVGLGRDFRRENTRWTPMVGLDYTWVDQRGYRERGDGGLGLTVRGDELNSLRIRFGAETERRYDRWALSAHGFFRYETLDRSAALDSFFTDAPYVRSKTEGQRLNRCSALIGSKLDWKWTERTNIALSYDFLVGDAFGEHRVDLGLHRSW